MKERKPERKFENSQGFSLLETSIALVIMMVVTLGTASLYVYATNYNAGSADRAASLALAQQKMERLRRTNFADADLTPGTTTENVTYASHHYTMVTTICNTSSCGGSDVRKIITVQVTPQGVVFIAEGHGAGNNRIFILATQGTVPVGESSAAVRMQGAPSVPGTPSQIYAAVAPNARTTAPGPAPAREHGRRLPQGRRGQGLS